MAWLFGAIGLLFPITPLGASATPIEVRQGTAVAIVQGVQDTQGPSAGAVEAYVETQDATLQYTWFASAKVDGPEMEVGVDLTRPVCCAIGASQAIASTSITLTNDTDLIVRGGYLDLVIPAGEVIFRDVRLLDREGIAFFDVTLRDVDTSTTLYHYRLHLITTNGGFTQDASSTANVPVDLLLTSGSQQGVKTLENRERIYLPDLGPYEVLHLEYVMEANGWSSPAYSEDAIGFSVKLGDPLTVGGGGTITFVPEPAASVLLAVALGGLVALAGRRGRAHGVALACAVLLLAAAARASDGVIEINQTCAEQNGCFPGDAPGFPVTVPAPGSYRLTSNLDLTATAATGVEITADHVSLDLGGFAIVGPNSCPGTPAVCTLPPGQQHGVKSFPRSGVEIRDGRIEGMTGAGLYLGSLSLARSVTVAHNGLGVSFEDGDLLEDILAVSNGADGIEGVGSVVGTRIAASTNGRMGIVGVSSASVWRGVAAANNATSGLNMVASIATVVSGVSADGNGTAGISCGVCAVHGNSARLNGGIGIASLDSNSGVAIVSNTLLANSADGVQVLVGPATVSDNAMRLNTGDGLDTGPASLVRGNTASDNNGVGLRLGEDSVYRENTITSNTAGTVFGTGNFQNATGNFCTDAADNTVACP